MGGFMLPLPSGLHPRNLLHVILGALLILLLVQSVSSDRVGRAQNDLPQTQNNIQAWFGDPNTPGNFNLQYTITGSPLIYPPAFVRKGQFLASSDLDLLVVGSDSFNCTALVYPGTGGGQLGAPSVFTNFCQGTTPSAIGVGDLDLDGRDDIIMGGIDGLIRIFLAG